MRPSRIPDFTLAAIKVNLCLPLIRLPFIFLLFMYSDYIMLKL